MLLASETSIQLTNALEKLIDSGIQLGERVLGRGLALEIVDAWINTEFEGDRHSKRVNMIKEIEERYNK